MSDESKEPAIKEKKGEANNTSNLNAACFRCRGFRHACDRKRPACTRCSRRGLTCTYPEAAPTLKKLQKATETLGDRIKKFSDRLKTGEGMPTISLQRLARGNMDDTTTNNLDPDNSSINSNNNNNNNNKSLGQSPDTRSIHSIHSDSASEKTFNTDQDEEDDRHLQKKKRVASTNHFSVYPCSKCFKDLQQCDLTLPQCSRCEANGFTCEYSKTEPKANHVSQVLNTMNKVMDQWQESIDKMAKDFAQKTRDFSAKANNSLKIKPMQPFAWKITSTNKGLSVESSVSSFNDLSTLVDQFKRSMNISSKPASDTTQRETSPYSEISEPTLELDDTSSITSSSFSFAIWNSWAHPTHAIPQDYPIDISQDLTDNLVELFCRTPCCSAIRIPTIDTAEFLSRYRDPDPTQRPAMVLVYAVCAMAARNAFQLHVWSKRPAFEAPQYNMGKALSMAYTLRGRELLAECFDEPSLDHCQAACILSYSNHQNGFPGVIYIYEWIAHTMAQDLGLYSSERELTQRERMLVWNLYYYNTWHRVLQGGSSSISGEGSQFYPRCPLPDLPVRPSADQLLASTPNVQVVNYYIQSLWVYLIQLQLLRERVMTRLVAAQETGKLDGKPDMTLPQDLLAMQYQLEQFYQQLPPDWRNIDLELILQTQQQSLPHHHHQPRNDIFNITSSSSSSSSSSSLFSPSPSSNDSSASSGTPPSQMDSPNSTTDEQRHYSVDGPAFAQYCVLYVHVFYYINQILLYQSFFSSDHIPNSEFAIQCLHICMHACASITRILEIMTKQCGECNVPLLAFIFANVVHIKLLGYHDDKSYQDFAVFHLQKSIEISKMSSNYTYDFELARTFVGLMEQDVQQRLATFYNDSNFNINDLATFNTSPSMNGTDHSSISPFFSASSVSSLSASPYLPSIVSNPSPTNHHL
ncbi:uncharacterized protein BX664DRAFT_340345 [Halteromyces radiatus]|uniref:uncharacterized protein n=1 Tax=Halteromyces radiatus TaxID=101107 RepID=UPI00221EE5CC|nr:uncharacterized protein BX664DRAFT_340345 [Halteromyces radiatus]KAI8081415.1 hypothetical protein BX664DRAFT_340345 [Halteromyces radiatus]